MSVRSPSLYALVPLSSALPSKASLVHDAMSGASPLYHDTLSGASGLGVTDYRTAADVKVTRYLDGQSIAVGGAYSNERDYESRAASVEWREVERRSQSHVCARFRRQRATASTARTGSPSASGARPTTTSPASRRCCAPTAVVESTVHVVGRPRLLFRSVQAARRPSRPSADLRVAHALQPVRSRGRRDAAHRLSLPARLVRRPVAHAGGVVDTAAAWRIRR